jgi:hypothetical protein
VAASPISSLLASIPFSRSPRWSLRRRFGIATASDRGGALQAGNFGPNFWSSTVGSFAIPVAGIGAKRDGENSAIPEDFPVLCGKRLNAHRTSDQTVRSQRRRAGLHLSSNVRRGPFGGDAAAAGCRARAHRELPTRARVRHRAPHCRSPRNRRTLTHRSRH